MYQLEQVRLWYSNKQLENTSGQKQQGFVYSSYLLSFFCQPKEFAYWIHSDTLADVSGIILGMAGPTHLRETVPARCPTHWLETYGLR